MSMLSQLRDMTVVVADTGDIDAMATEKLAEGIRLFTGDLLRLIGYVAEFAPGQAKARVG